MLEAEKASGYGSTAVEHLTHIPKVKGLTPAAGTGNDRMAGKCFSR